MHELIGWVLIPAVTNVKLNPDPGGLPGSKVLQGLVNGLGFWALLAALAGMVVGCIVWAAGAHGQNHHMAGRGRLGTLACAASKLFVRAVASAEKIARPNAAPSCCAVLSKPAARPASVSATP